MKSTRGGARLDCNIQKDETFSIQKVFGEKILSRILTCFVLFKFKIRHAVEVLLQNHAF